jgi:hypothetical protein
MDKNKRETANHFAPKAFGALECGGPPQDGFAVANLTPLFRSANQQLNPAEQ